MTKPLDRSKEKYKKYDGLAITKKHANFVFNSTLFDEPDARKKGVKLIPNDLRVGHDIFANGEAPKINPNMTDRNFHTKKFN